MTERERLLYLIKQAEKDFSDTGKPILNIEEYVVDYLLSNGVHITACATCDYIKYTKEKGMLIELMGKPIKYCPECGEKLE